MLEMAVERGMPLEVIQQFMALAERLEQMRERDRQRKAENAYIAALAALKSKVVTVLKTRHVKYPTKDRDGRTNGSVDFKHAELADIMEAVAPAAAEVGLSWNYPELEQSKDWVRVTCRLQHIDGYSERVTLGGAPDDSGRKNALQQIASAITYLERYTLKALLGISEKGDDTDSRGRDNANGDGSAGEGGQDAAGQAEAKQTRMDALRKDGFTNAKFGEPALNKWWAALTAKERNDLGRDFAEMKKKAREATKGATQ
jgi:hypothetical protein